MVRKPNKLILKTLAKNIEQAMEDEDCQKAIKACKVFVSMVETYRINKKLMQKERI